MISESFIVFLFISGFYQQINLQDENEDIEQYEIPEEMIEIVIGILSFILFLLSLSAYLATKVKKLIFAVGAFGLFTVSAAIDVLEDKISIFDPPYMDLLLSFLMLSILVLFFLAIIQRK
jgi:hypothetical protein